VADMKNVIAYSKLQQYADDSQVYTSFSTDSVLLSQQLFNRDLNSIQSYAENHNLKLNASKSCILFFGSNQRDVDIISQTFSVQIFNTKIPVVTEANNLGVILDNKLTFVSHINKKISIAYMRLKQLYNFKKYLTEKTKYYLCNTLILSLFENGDVVYNDAITLTTSRSIQKVQNSCLRFTYGIPYRNHITPYLNEHSILSMLNRRNYHLFSFIYRIMQTGKPPYLRNLFNIFEHNYYTRNYQTFRIMQHSTAAFQRSFSYVATRAWNGLPAFAKEYSVYKFKEFIKAMLLEEQSIM